MSRKYPLFFACGLAGVLLDQVAKWCALAFLEADDPVRWLRDDIIGLQLRFNYGASFSFAEGYTWVFTIIGIVAVIIIPFFVRESKVWNVSLALVWAGALGNLIDRLFAGDFGRGPVTDFIVYSSWFTGNIADIFLVLGAIGLFVFVLMESTDKESIVGNE